MCCQDQLYQTCALAVGNRFTFVSAFLQQSSRLFTAAQLYFPPAVKLFVQNRITMPEAGVGWGSVHVPAGCVMVSYYSHS